MSKTFKKPDFTDGILELRVEDSEICIYASKSGLQRLSEFCQKLINEPKTGHIHLEDYQVLTPDSLKGVIAIFEKEKGLRVKPSNNI